MDFSKLSKLFTHGGKGAGLLFGVGATYLGIKNSFYTVDGGHRSIMYNRIGGVAEEIYQEGLHFRIPWFQYPVIFDIRSRPRTISSPTGSKDLQMVNISLRVLSRPEIAVLPNIYRQLGLDFDERVLPSIMNEVLKSVVAQFTASQLITKRQEVSLRVRRALVDRAKDFNIIVDDVSITDLSFSPVYAAAVEKKQIAQQEAQRAQFTVERAVQEKQQKIVNAEGEARAAQLIGDAVTQNPGYLKLRKIKAAQNVANTLSSGQNKAYLNANNLMLNLHDLDFDESVSKASVKKR